MLHVPDKTYGSRDGSPGRAPRVWARHHRSPRRQPGDALSWTPPLPRWSWLRNVAVFVVVGLVCLLALTVGQPLGHATSRQPEAFTELYFAQPLPGISAGLAPGKVQVSFTVHNVGGAAASYPYTITLGGAVIARSATPAVAPSAAFTTSQWLPRPRGQGQVELLVELASGQSLRTWVPRDHG